MSRPAHSWRLNHRAAIVLSLVAVVLLGSMVGLWLFQARPGHAADLLGQAEALAAQGPNKDDLAISYLDEALARDPNLVAALDLKAELRARGGRGAGALNDAFQLGDRALRLAPEAPTAQATRRRQVELALRLMPLVPRDQWRLGVAELLARERIDRGARDADAFRLLARVEQAIGDKASLGRAVEDYERARKLDPRDPETAAALATICQNGLNDPARAERVLDDLIKAGDTAAARLARHQFYAAIARDRGERGRDVEAESLYRRADAELARAEALAPDDTAIHLAAAGYHLDRGRLAEARDDLKRIPQDRVDFRYRITQGMIDLRENRADDAIAAWQRGLLATSGTNAELTWRLAFVLLSLGRHDEAAPLIEQFQRLAGGPETPQAKFLRALGLAQRNQPVAAIGLLESIQHQAGELASQVYFQLGRCYEAVREEEKAIEQYGRAVQLDGQFAAARSALVRVLQSRRPEQAEAEARKAGSDPAMLVSLAQLELRRQRARPADRRDYREAERLLAAAAARAPADPMLLLAQAELFDATRRGDEAFKRLEAATRDRRLRAVPAIWLAYAERLVRLGRAAEAARALEQASAPDAAGDQVALRVARAKLMTLRGRGAEARTLLVDDLDRLPPGQRPEAWRALAGLYAAAHRGEEARRAYAKWAELLPQDPYPRLFLFEFARAADDAKTARAQLDALKEIGGEQGLFYRVARAEDLLGDHPGEGARARTGRLAEAEALIARLEADEPSQPFGPLLRGRLLEDRDQVDQAARAYEKALEKGGAAAVLPRLVRIYAEHGRATDLDRLRREHGAALPGMDRLAAEAALKRGDKDQAAELARRVVAGDPESLDLRVWQARVLNALGKPAEAEATLRELVERRPGEAAPWLALLAFQAGLRAATGGTAGAAAPTAEQVRATVEQMRQKVQSDRPEFLQAQAWRLAGERGRAASAFEASLAKWPDVPEVVRAAADFYSNVGRPADADRIFDAARRRDPAARWATRSLAILRAAQAGDRPEAWRAAWALLAETPAEVADAPEERLAQAIVLADGPEPAQRHDAAEILRRLVGDLPADLPAAALARQLLALLEIREGHPDRAADVLAGDAEAADASATTLSRYIEALIAARRFEAAEKALARLGASEPGAATLPRAKLLHARGRGPEAVALLERAVAGQLKAAAAPAATAAAGRSAEATARAACDLLRTWKQPEAAARVADALVAARPQAAWVRAALLAEQGQPAEALANLKAAAEVVEPAALLDIGRRALALAVGDGPTADPALADTAAEILVIARRRAGAAPELIALEGNLLHLQGRHDDALRAYSAALQGAGDDPQFLNNLAWTLAVDLGRPAEALTRIDQAIRRGGAAPTFLDTRGVVYTRLGKSAEAIRDLEEATRASKPKATYLAHLALAYHQAGRLDDFRQARDRARAAGLTIEQFDPAERRQVAALFEE